MIPSRVFPRVTLCSVRLPVHDPPVIWKSWRGHGGNPGIELAPHPALATKAVRRIDVNDLTWLEPISDYKSGEGR